MATARMTHQVTRDETTYTTVLKVEVDASYPDAVDEAVVAVQRLWNGSMVEED